MGEGRSVATYNEGETVFAQGDPVNAVFYTQRGEVKISVVSEQGKEAVVAIVGANAFFGEGCLTAQTLRVATAVAMTNCEVGRHLLARGGVGVVIWRFCQVCRS